MTTMSYNQTMAGYAAPSVSIFSDRTLTTRKANSTIYNADNKSWKNFIIFLLCLLLATLTCALFYIVSHPNCQEAKFSRLTSDHDNQIRYIRSLLISELQNSTKLANEVSVLKQILKDIQTTASLVENPTENITQQ